MANNWSQIKKEYVTGDESLSKLAEKHGVSDKAIKSRSTKEKWVEQREAYRDAKTVREIQATADKEIERYQKILDSTDILLAKIYKKIDAIDEDEMTSVFCKQITGAIKEIKDIQGIKSDRDREEQEARIRKLNKEADGELNDNKSIVVKIEGDTSWQV